MALVLVFLHPQNLKVKLQVMLYSKQWNGWRDCSQSLRSGFTALENCIELNVLSIAGIYFGKNLVQNSNFSNTSYWSCYPSWNSNNYCGVVPPYVQFSWAALGSATVSQNVSLPGTFDTYQFRVDIGCYWGGSFSIAAEFYDSGKKVLEILGSAYQCSSYYVDADQSTKTFAFITTRDMRSAVSATIFLSGQDNKNWVGLFGPQMTNIQLYGVLGSSTLGETQTCLRCPTGTYSSLLGRTAQTIQ